MILVLLLSLVGAQERYDIDHTSLVLLPLGDQIVLEHRAHNRKEIWVPGTYPHPELIFEEGRFGHFEGQANSRQQFTVSCPGCQVGQIISLDFWLIKPESLDLWFGNKDYYLALHKDAPYAKTILIKVVAPHKQF